ncbi:MAG: TauD/TfdA family dioxygenase [Burkholderiaceae bacterium]
MTDMLTEPYRGPSAWRRADMQADPQWIRSLDAHAVAELRDAVAAVYRQGADLSGLTRDDFALPRLGPRIVQLRDTLETGRGFELWRGLPVNEWNDDERRIAFWGLGLHLGAPVVQNARGELLGSVINTSSTDPQTNANSRFYHTNRAAPFHVDGADTVGLLCVRTAMSGGASLIVSSTSIYNAVLREAPDLLELLYQPLWFDHRGERNAVTGEPYWVTSICGWANGKLSMMYLRAFLESAQRYENAPPLTDRHYRLFDLVDRLAASDELCLSMDFRPGDIQWLNNHVILHSRTRFDDYTRTRSGGAQLLRLWLSFDQRDRFSSTYGFYGIARDDQQAAHG